MSEWEAPQIEMTDALEQLSSEGKKEWELAASKAVIVKLTGECQSLFDQVQLLEGELKNYVDPADDPESATSDEE